MIITSTFNIKIFVWKQKINLYSGKLVYQQIEEKWKHAWYAIKNLILQIKSINAKGNAIFYRLDAKELFVPIVPLHQEFALQNKGN